MKIKEITKYRSCWMGFAIIWLVIYHGQAISENNLFAAFQNIGYGGVDIFLLSSGLGCYYSLDRDSDSIHFLKKRFLNLMPTYWCFIIVWILFKKLTSDISVFAAVGNFLGIEMFASTEESFNWYITGIWVLYILAPIFKRVADHCRTLISQLAILALLFAVSLPFWNSSILIMFVSRIPVFYLGMIIGKLIKIDFEVKRKHAVLILMGTVAGFTMLIYGFRLHPSMLMSCGIMWYPFFLIAPGMCFAISWILIKTENKPFGNAIEKVLQTIGGSTFEIYLIHLFVFEGIYRYLLDALTDFPKLWLKIICFIMIIPGTLILKKCGNAARKQIELHFLKLILAKIQ